MDRQPLTDRLGDRLLAEYGGAAAAYSLRALNGNGDNVVRVRRASDNNEKDFTAEQIELGEMVNWVNSQTVPPLDIGVETSEGRIPVPEGGTSIGTPAAAYSLRNLSTTYTGNVVDVRRSSDDAVESFTATEVADGTLEDWVNAVGVARNRTSVARWSSFTATSTGFDAATLSAGACGFDLVGSSGNSVQVSFDVVINSGSFSVQLRNGFDSGSSVSNSESINSSGSKSFTLTATSDFVALQFISVSADIEITNFSIDVPWTYDGFVSKWYDQSGNDNHATQGTAEKQPKIVDAGSLVSGGIDFDGTDDWLDVSGINEAQPITGFVQLKPDTTTDAENEVLDGTIVNTNRILLDASSGNWRFFAGSVLTGASVETASSLLYFLANSTSSEFGLNGGASATGDAGANSGWADGLTIGTSMSGNFYNGQMGEIIIYNSDQSDNRTAIEANIGETYGITGIPAYDNTVDGFVETWYDQSGNGNDATQTVAASQPKIVDAGTYLGEIDFDGSDDFMQMESLVTLGTEFYLGMVVQPIAGESETNATFLGAARFGGGDRFYLLTNDNKLSYRNNGTNSTTTLTPSGTEAELVSYTATASNITTALNGTEDVDAALAASMGAEYIGGGTGFNISAHFKELIIYSTDQSANRPAIEANINNQYDIY